MGREGLAYARQEGYAVLREGESDRWTCLYYSYPCLSIPGASAVGCLTAEDVKDIPKLYLIQEPDSGGQHFIPAMAQQLRKLGWNGQAYVIAMNGAKDPNELHKQDPEGFRGAFQAAWFWRRSLPQPCGCSAAKATPSALIRQAWDTGDLRVLTKNSPAEATGAHISIVGHITRDELLRYLDSTESGNGFGNRISWCCVKRSKRLT